MRSAAAAAALAAAAAGVVATASEVDSAGEEPRPAFSPWAGFPRAGFPSHCRKGHRCAALQAAPSQARHAGATARGRPAVAKRPSLPWSCTEVVAGPHVTVARLANAARLAEGPGAQPPPPAQPHRESDHPARSCLTTHWRRPPSLVRLLERQRPLCRRPSAPGRPRASPRLRCPTWRDPRQRRSSGDLQPRPPMAAAARGT